MSIRRTKTLLADRDDAVGEMANPRTGAGICEKKRGIYSAPGDRLLVCPHGQSGEGRDGPIRIPLFHGGHLPLFASSMTQD